MFKKRVDEMVIGLIIIFLFIINYYSQYKQFIDLKGGGKLVKARMEYVFDGFQGHSRYYFFLGGKEQFESKKLDSDPEEAKREFEELKTKPYFIYNPNNTTYYWKYEDFVEYDLYKQLAIRLFFCIFVILGVISFYRELKKVKTKQ